MDLKTALTSFQAAAVKSQTFGSQKQTKKLSVLVSTAARSEAWCTAAEGGHRKVGI